MNLNEQNPTKKEFSDAFGALAFTRLAPVDQSLTADYETSEAAEGFQAEIQDLDGRCVCQLDLAADCRTLQCNGLQNDQDYFLHLRAFRGSSVIAKAPTRLFRCGRAPGTVVNYIHPEDYTYMPSGRSPASPSLLRLASGRLLASHDIFWGKCDQNHSLVFSSDDQGKSWQFLSHVFPCFWGKLFEHRGQVYMLGMSYEYGDLQIFRSLDGGASWSEPAIILAGGNNEKGGPHKAPMPVIAWAGRLWTAVDYGSWFLGGHANGLLSVAEDADLIDPANWSSTGFLAYDPSWPGTSRGKSGGCLEGNAVVSPEGRLFNLLRYQTNNCRPDYGKAILLEADASRPTAPLRFFAVVDFPGNLSKFKVDYDPVSRRYYALVSRVTTPALIQRNVLSLTSSADLLTWRIERDILNYADNGWPEPLEKVGFQYVDWLFDGEDIVALSRTAINGAFNFHNANQITWHRIGNFRR